MTRGEATMTTGDCFYSERLSSQTLYSAKKVGLYATHADSAHGILGVPIEAVTNFQSENENKS
jgi:hypothetical protein